MTVLHLCTRTKEEVDMRQGHDEFKQRAHDFDAAEAATEAGDPDGPRRMKEALESMKEQRDTNASRWGVGR